MSHPLTGYCHDVSAWEECLGHVNRCQFAYVNSRMVDRHLPMD